MVRGGRAEAPPRSDVSFRLDQKTANVKAAIGSRPMQWSFSPEEKQKNDLARKEFRFVNTIIIIIIIMMMMIIIIIIIKTLIKIMMIIIIILK